MINSVVDRPTTTERHDKERKKNDKFNAMMKDESVPPLAAATDAAAAATADLPPAQSALRAMQEIRYGVLLQPPSHHNHQSSGINTSLSSSSSRQSGAKVKLLKSNTTKPSSHRRRADASSSSPKNEKKSFVPRDGGGGGGFDGGGSPFFLPGKVPGVPPLQQQSGGDDGREVLGSPWWVRLGESNGTGPGHRRAHSAVVYRVPPPPELDGGELLDAEEDGADGAGAGSGGGGGLSGGTTEGTIAPPSSPPAVNASGGGGGGALDGNNATNGTAAGAAPPPPHGNSTTTPVGPNGGGRGRRRRGSTIRRSLPTDAGAAPLHTKNSLQKEYMIITGGFSDDDFTTFPVWAYDMTTATLTGTGSWIDLTPANSGEYCHSGGGGGRGLADDNGNEESDGEEEHFDLWSSALSCAPPGRVGHVSAVYGGYLYVFGGLLYDQRDGVFKMENGGPFVYRRRLDHILGGGYTPTSASSSAGEEETDRGWERIVPDIITPPTEEAMSKSTLHALLNRGEVQGGQWLNQRKFVIYGGLHVRAVASITMHGHRVEQVDTPLGDVWSYDFQSDAWEMLSPGGGGADGGGGAAAPLPPPPEPGLDIKFPRARTAHAATVVNDELVVYGGMGKLGADTTSSGGGEMSRGNSWGTQTSSTEWEALDDVWVFDLNDRVWRRREVYPSLARAYHSLVGWENNGSGGSSVAAFGGYRTVEQPVAEESVAFVFDDTLVSHPPSPNSTYEVSTWLKASWPMEYEETVSHRLEHTAVLSDVFGSMYVWGGRFQDTRQIEGMWSLNVAGPGSTVTYHLAEPDGLEEYEATVAAMHLLVAAMMFMSMMFTAMCGLMSRQHAMMDDDNVGFAGIENDGVNGGVLLNGGGGGGRRGRGLRQEVIDSLPVKKYGTGVIPSDLSLEVSIPSGDDISDAEKDLARCASPSSYVSMDDTAETAASSPSSTDGGSEPSNGGGGVETPLEGDCCPICLLEYEQGDEVRTLPCRHEFHKTCVDPWLGNNASCPACRHSLRGLCVPATTTTTARRSPASRFSFFRTGPLRMTPQQQPPAPRGAAIDLSSSPVERESGADGEAADGAAAAATRGGNSSNTPPQRQSTVGGALGPLRPSFLFMRFLGSTTDRLWFGHSPFAPTARAGRANGVNNDAAAATNNGTTGGSEGNNNVGRSDEFHDEIDTIDELDLPYVSSLELTEETSISPSSSGDGGGVVATATEQTGPSSSRSGGGLSSRTTRPMRLGRGGENSDSNNSRRRRRTRIVGRRAARFGSRTIPLNDPLHSSSSGAESALV